MQQKCKALLEEAMKRTTDTESNSSNHTGHLASMEGMFFMRTPCACRVYFTVFAGPKILKTAGAFFDPVVTEIQQGIDCATRAVVFNVPNSLLVNSKNFGLHARCTNSASDSDLKNDLCGTPNPTVSGP